jgi:hypothetical protein
MLAMATRTVNDGNLVPIKSDGTPAVAASSSPLPVGLGYGYTLMASQTYYVEIGRPYTLTPGASPDPNGARSFALGSLQVIGDSALVITTIEIEDTNVPEVTTHSSSGEWTKENPATAYVACTGNCSATVAVVAKTTGAVGSAMFHLVDGGALRQRAKIVVGSTGGVARFLMSGKG